MNTKQTQTLSDIYPILTGNKSSAVTDSGNAPSDEVKFDLGMLAADAACSVKWEIEKAGKTLRPEYFARIAKVIRESLYASNY